MRTTLARPLSLFVLSSLLLSSACNDKGSDPTAVWDDERVRNQGTLVVSPSSFQVREGESVTLHADYEGSAQFSPSQVNWTVRPAGAGSVENGIFTADVAGDVSIEGRFSSIADTAEATIRPELIDFVPVSDSLITASAGQVVPDSVTVQVLGRGSAPVSGEVVEFEVVDGDGNISRSQRVTGVDGTARVAWLLGPRPGQNRLRAAVERFNLEFRADGRPDRATAGLRRASAESREGTVGEPLVAPLVVDVRDMNGNALPGVRVEWRFLDGSGSTDPAGASASDTVVLKPSGGDGRSVVYWTLGGRAGEQKVVASLVDADGDGPGRGAREVTFRASARAGDAATLDVEPKPIAMSVGHTVTLEVEGRDGFENRVEVAEPTWVSADPGIAFVDASGAVTAAAEGTTTVEARSGAASGSTQITVVGPHPAGVETVVADRDEVVFDRLGEEVDVDAVARDEGGAVVADAELSWTSSDPAVATVSLEGVVRAVGNGTADVSVRAECCAAADTVRVTVVEPDVVEVRASSTSLHFSRTGATTPLGVELLDARGLRVTTPVAWTSENPSVATVDGSGRVTAVGNGSTRILVSPTCCEATDTVDIVVLEPVFDYVEANPKSVDLTVGDTASLEAVGYDTAGDTADVDLTWTSTNSNVVSVDQVGTIIAKGQGIAAIVVAAACCTASDTVLVGVDEEPITPSRVEASWEDIRFRALEQEFQLEAAAFDEQERTVVDARFTWRSTDPSVVSVDSMGLVTARANGLAAIVLASSCCTVADTVPVTVDQEVSLVSVEPGAVTLEVGQERDLRARVEDANGFSVDVPRSWRSTNPMAATVDDAGHVVARAEGQADVELEAAGLMGLATTSVIERSDDPKADPLFADDFETGTVNSSADGFSWRNGPSAVSSDNARSGNFSLRFEYGPDAPGEDSWSELRFDMPPLQEVWFDFWLYIPDGTESYGGAAYDHRDDEGPDNNKFWLLTDQDKDYNVRALLEARPSGSDGQLTRARPMWGTNAGRGGVASSSWGLPSVDFISQADRGRWIHLAFQVKVSDSDQSNGVWRMWKNEELIVDGTGIANSPIDGVSRQYKHGYLMGWANSGFTNSTYLFIDDFRMYRSNPGW